MDRRGFMAGAAIVPLFPALAWAGTAPVFATDGTAIHGFDPVGYFRDRAPVKGRETIALGWRGARWLFASEENRRMFEADPGHFAPRYGGYCAYAMAHGAIASTVPEAWTVYEGRLYLNYSTAVRSQWSQDIPGYIARADKVWPGILDG